ncbi:hypothetical protein PRIPAC_78135, partial [Pristionchus pacificus]
ENKDSSSDVPPPSSLPFFSRHSHRLIICLLLLIGNYFGFANSMGMSTAVVCMVNSSLTINRFDGKTNEQSCPIQHDESSMEQEFAIPGTMDWSPSQQSLLLSARFYGSCITVTFSGIIADRFGPDLVLTVALFLSSIFTLFTPLLSYANYNLLLVSRVLMGAIESFHQPSINCLATRWFPSGEKTIAASIYTTGYQFAAGLSSLFAASLCKSTLLGGWPSIFYVFGGSCCIFIVFWIMFGIGGPSKNRWLNDNEKKYLEDRIRIRMKGGKRTIPLSRILLSNPVHSIVLCNFAFAFSTSIMTAFLPLFLRELGLPIDTIGWYTLTPFLAQIAGKAVIGPLIDYCAGKKIISLTMATKIAQSMGSFGASIALILLSILPSCSNPTVAFYILIIYGVVYSGGTCGFYTSMLSISPKNMGTLSTLTAISRILAAIVSTSIVNALTATGTPYKWTFIFASAALFQSIGGLHFLIFGTTEVQSW